MKIQVPSMLAIGLEKHTKKNKQAGTMAYYTCVI